MSKPSAHPHSATEPATKGAAARVKKQTLTSNRLLWSVGALAAWILLFAAGLLIETVEYRLVLAPRSIAKQLGPEGMKSVPGAAATVPASAATITPAAATEPVAAATGPAAAAGAKESVDSLSVINRVAYSCFAFFASLFCFTPINLALLTLAAGLIGGCASNITVESMPDERRAALNKANSRRIPFLQEPPISAAIRGFIVFLGVIAGLYVAMDDPFKDPTPGQYIRLAGLLSIMAFIVGYDASRLEDWLRAIPGPNGGRHENESPTQPKKPSRNGDDEHPLSDDEQNMADKEAAAR